MDYSQYLQFTNTDKQKELLHALIENNGKMQDASKVVGIGLRGGYQILKRIKDKAVKQGYSPDHDMTKSTAPGYHVKGVSTLYDDAGNLKIQWVKTQADKQQQDENFKEYITGLCEEIIPAKKIKLSKNKKHDPNLMSGIFIGDGHLGMYAYGKETKHSDFDSDIATRDIRAAIDDLISRSPSSETGLLVDVGDFIHANTSHNTTWSGTPLDVDTRHHRIMRMAGLLMRYCIDKMLTKYKKVIVVVAKGNHNPDAAVGVQLMVEFYYSNEPRVNVLATEGFFHYIEWGKWLIGVNHGDKVKPAKLASVMARDMAPSWGRTTHRMWALGHFHHQDVLEVDGCIVQKFAALPPPDSWHSSMGFSSGQAMQMINFKKDGGRHSTLIYELEKPKIEPDVRI